MDRRLTNAIAIVVTVVWTISFIADIAMREYDPSPFIHLAMMAIVGAAFGHSMFGKQEKEGRGE